VCLSIPGRENQEEARLCVRDASGGPQLLPGRGGPQDTRSKVRNNVRKCCDGITVVINTKYYKEGHIEQRLMLGWHITETAVWESIDGGAAVVVLLAVFITVHVESGSNDPFDAI